MMYFNAKDVYDLIEECKYMETHMSTRPGHLVLDVNKFKDKLGHLAGSGTDFGIDSNTYKFFSHVQKLFSVSAEQFIHKQVEECFGTTDLSIILRNTSYEIFIEMVEDVIADLASHNREVVMGEELIDDINNEICLAMHDSPEGEEEFDGLTIDGNVHRLHKYYWKSTGTVYSELAEFLNKLRRRQNELNEGSEGGSE